MNSVYMCEWFSCLQSPSLVAGEQLQQSSLQLGVGVQGVALPERVATVGAVVDPGLE